MLSEKPLPMSVGEKTSEAQVALQSGATTLDPYKVKAHFPIFANNVLSKNLSYLDNAATSQKPNTVISAMNRALTQFNSPVHRGFYPLAEHSSDYYEQARERLRSFIGASSARSCVFTSGATESINHVAQGFLLPRLKPGQAVWVTRMEHHANFLPWQAVCEQAGAHLHIIELNEDGELALDKYPELFGDNTAMIALTHTSNVLGVVNNVEAICRQAQQNNIPVLLDAAQAMTSHKIDVSALACDFLVFSAHKMFGPNGIGLLYISDKRIAQMQPTKLGGGMVEFTGDSMAQTSFAEAPHCFEAGSPNLASAIGFAAACDFVCALEQDKIKQHIEALALTFHHALSNNPHLKHSIRVVSPIKHAASGIISFYHEVIHAHDLAQIMGDANVAVRAGHHCAQPLLRHLNVSSTLRISLSAYNTEADIQAAIRALERAHEIFS